MTKRAVTFYRGDYRPEDSVGWLMKRVLLSIVQQAEQRLAPHGLTHAQWQPLMRLRAGPMAIAELARELQLDAGATTRLIDRLERKGLCARERSREDRRVVHVVLTPAGQEAAALVPDVLSDVLNGHLAGFTRAEWQTLLDLLRRMLGNGEALRAQERETGRDGPTTEDAETAA